MCFGCSKEPSHRDGSFEYPQHMFWLRNIKSYFSCALLSRGLEDMCIQLRFTQFHSKSSQSLSFLSEEVFDH